MAVHPPGATIIVYEIRVEGQLDPQWSAWFDDLMITHDTPASTLLRGELPDESALHGVLRRLNGLNLHLLSVRRVASSSER
jgi:hypothetical protein